MLNLFERFRQVRARTERLCESLLPEDHCIQSMPDVSPPKWHLAHTTWFFEEFCANAGLATPERFNPSFDFLFNSYYKTKGAHYERTQRGLLARPGVREIARYRSAVNERILKMLAVTGGEKRIEESTAVLSGQRAPDEHPSDFLTLIELGLHHEQQHQELLLTDIKHIFGTNPLHPVYLESTPPHPHAVATRVSRWVDFAGGKVEIGNAGPGFRFDNEGPRHTVWLEPFALAAQLVNQGEFLEFIAAGGYRQPALWLSDGWDWKEREQIEAPLYWQKTGTEWNVFTLHGLRALDPTAPVCHLSFYEADAFAKWRGARLPTEEEWEWACLGAGATDGTVEPSIYHPQPAAERAPLAPPTAVASARELQQLFGEVWQWTQSPYHPYPRFQPLVGTLGEYNGKFMCNQMVLRGSSRATPPGHSRPTYRNFFPPTARWQFSGLRLAQNRPGEMADGTY